MEKSIILLLFFSFVLAITSFYLGFIEPSKNLGHAAKLFFVLVIVILIPLFAGILWFQSSAKERLMDTGIVPYPGIGETIGIAFGTGDRPVWLFRTVTDKLSIGSFYTNENNRPGWNLTESGEQSAILINTENKMTIKAQTGSEKGSVMYLMDKIPVD
ncbi:MAG: hypothetical protein V3U15_00405 [Nitrospinota bacterium]